LSSDTEESISNVLISFTYKDKNHKAMCTYSHPVAFMSNPALILNILEPDKIGKCKGKFLDPFGTGNEGCIVTIELKLDDDDFPIVPQDTLIGVQAFRISDVETFPIVVDGVMKLA
jgi:hypothetical protein